MLGDVRFEAEDQGYVLVLDANALVAIEDETGLGLDEMGEAFEKPTMRMLRLLFWAGLQTHHAGVTLTEAGRLMGVVGIDKAAPLIVRAVQAAFPGAKRKGGAGGEAGPGPRKPSPGTGKASSPTGSKPTSTRNRSGGSRRA